MRTIHLKRVNHTPLQGYPAYGMEVSVTSADNMPKEVFVKQRFGLDASNDTFACIASAVQLEELPINIPGPTTSYFRTDEVSLIALTEDALDAIYEAILVEVEALIANLDALDNVTVETTSTISSS